MKKLNFSMTCAGLVLISWSQAVMAIASPDRINADASLSEEFAIDSSRLSAQSAFQLRHFQQLVDENDWVSASEVFEKVKRVEDRRGE